MKNVINDLVGYKDLKIIQCNDYFSFSLDSVILPNFVKINSDIKKIIDLGCGNAPIPLILSTKTEAHIIGVEIQKEIYKLAVDTIKLNKLENKIEIINEDIKNIPDIYKSESFDIVLSNPPYFKVSENSLLNHNKIKTNARHETLININEILKVSKKILKNHGLLYLIHRTERLSDIIENMQKYNIEPKRIRFIYPKKNSNSNLVLIEGKKNGNKGLKVEKPLIVHNENGGYSEEILQMFF